MVTRSVNQRRAYNREAMMAVADVDWNALSGSTTAAEKRERTTLRDLRIRYLGK